MARISLLFTLALVLAIGSILAHPPSQKKTPKILCPSTLSKLQTFPFTDISQYLEKMAQTAPDTIQFKALLAICKGYNDYIGAFTFSGTKDVFGSVHAKFALMTNALFAAQAYVGVNGELAVKLSTSYSAMAEGYVHLVEKISAISSKYKFNANAQINLSDRAEIQKCVIKLKGAIRVYVKVISQCSKTFSPGKKTGISTGAGGLIGTTVKHGLEFGGKAGVHAGVKLGARVGAKVGTQRKAKGGAHAGAKAGGKFGELFREFFGFGGKAQFDAAGKVKVGGGNGFRSLSQPHEKHFN